MKTKQERIREAEERCRKEIEAIEAEPIICVWCSWEPVTTSKTRTQTSSDWYIVTSDITPSEVLIKQEAERIQLYLRMRKFADENNGEFGEEKYYVHYNSESGKVEISLNDWFTLPMLVYFSDDKIAEKAREKFGPEILRVWGK